MLMKRATLIAILMVLGAIIASISMWALVFNANSSNVSGWTPIWYAQRLPILIGVLMIVGGFRMLGSTRVKRPLDEIEEDESI